MAWCLQAPSHYLRQCWCRFMLPYGITRPWVNWGLMTWRHRTGSTLAQVMAYCLMAPSHQLNQRWFIISARPMTVTWGQFHKISHQSLKLAGKLQSKILFKSPRGQWMGLCVFWAALFSSYCHYHPLTSVSRQYYGHTNWPDPTTQIGQEA